MTKQTERTLSVACPTCKALPGHLCTDGGVKTAISCHSRKMKGREIQKNSRGHRKSD